MSVYNNDGWKWALRTFHDLSRHETRVHFQLAQDQRCELEETLSSIINNKALSMPRSKHQSCLIISRNALKVQWKFCITDETSVMAKTKIHETNPTKKKKSSNRDFQMYHGHLHTHWWCRVTWYACMEFVNGHFYHCASRSDAGETCVAGLSSLSASTRFHPIWRLPMMQVSEIPSSYSYLIISD